MCQRFVLCLLVAWIINYSVYLVLGTSHTIINIYLYIIGPVGTQREIKTNKDADNKILSLYESSVQPCLIYHITTDTNKSH